MKTHTRISFLIVFLILLSLVVVNLTHAQQTPDNNTPNQITSGEANLPWTNQYIQQQLDPPKDVGRFVSMALRPFDDSPVIAYYDGTNFNLMVAIPVPGHTGNCGTANNWYCYSVDGGGILAVGMFSSIDLWGYSVDNWKMGISYYDETNRALKAAIWTCSSGSCESNIVTIQAPDSPSDSIGLYSSFKFNSTGMAAIAYFITGQSSTYLEYAYQVPSGGNCGVDDAAGLWQCTLISIGIDSKYASLDFNYEDIPYIGYYNAKDGDLKIAYHYSGIHYCDEFDWTCFALDSNDDVGLFPSLIAPQFSGDALSIAYYDKTNGNLKFYDSTAGTQVIDHMGITPEPMGISMAIDNEGSPVISYQKFTSDFSPAALSIARPYLSYNDGAYGNCGDIPPGWSFHFWRCTTLDYGSQYTEVANYVSIVINSRHRVAIAYSEFVPDYFVMSVKIIYQTSYRTFMPVTAKQ